MFVLSEVQRSFRIRYGVASMAAVLDMLRTVQWISFDDEGNLSITARGREIRKCDSHAAALRLQLMDYIGLTKPSWSSLVPRGRLETMSYLPPDVRQCFNEAGLNEGYGDDVVEFWDAASSVCRGRTNDTLLEIGRRGERLSIEYEIGRTGREPLWKSIDSNLAGYDLLSVVSKDDPRPLKIEVKAANRKDGKVFFVSKNEWETAITGSYVFHIWLLGDEPQLLLKLPSEVEVDIPVNRGSGSWQSVSIAVA
jgi:hypothetical protein